MKKYLTKISNDKLIDTINRLAKIKRKLRSPRKESMTKSLIVTDEILKESRDFRLEAEVVGYALMYMRDNPKSQLSEAMIAGYEEWIK